MAQTNILTGLHVSSQSPLDGKTTVPLLSSITDYGLNNEKVYTYHANMPVLVMSTGKNYTWRQYSSEEGLGVSPLFTYPAGHIVDGIDYSGKTYTFYENVNNVVPPEPEPHTTYRTKMYNLDYTTVGDMDNQARLWAGQAQVIDGDTIFEEFSIRPIASRTLLVTNPPNNVGWGGSPNTAVPLRIELYPPNAVTISTNPNDGSDYESMADVVEAVNNNEIAAPEEIVLLPSIGSPVHVINLPTPVNWNTLITVPRNAVVDVRTPILSPVSGVTQRVRAEAGSTLLASSTIIEYTPNANVSLVGAGSVIGLSSQPLVRRSTGTFSARNATPANLNLPSSLGVEIEGVNISVVNGSIADIDASINFGISNVNIESNITGISLINSEGGNLEMSNVTVNVPENRGSSILNITAPSTIEVSEMKVVGDIKNVINVTNASTGSSEVNITNSDFRKSNINKIIEFDSATNNIDVSKYTINTTSFNESSSTDETLKEIRVFSSNTQTKNVVEILQHFPNRDRAALVLPKYSLFINTNGDKAETSEYFLDVVI